MGLSSQGEYHSESACAATLGTGIGVCTDTTAVPYGEFMFTQDRVWDPPTPGRALANFPDAYLHTANLSTWRGPNCTERLFTDAIESMAAALRATGNTKVTGFNVDNGDFLYLFGVKAVITGMGFQASSEGSKQSPKAYHEGVNKAMTLTTKGERIFTQSTQVTGFNVANFAFLYLLA